MVEINTIGLDIAKNVFRVPSVDAAGRAVLRRQLRRGEVLKFFAGLPRCLVGMHYGITVTLYVFLLRVTAPALPKRQA